MSESVEDFERHSGGSGNSMFPDPGPATEEEFQNPLLMDREMAYFEPIGPITEHIVWGGKRIVVTFRLLDIDEERMLTEDIEHIPGAEKIFVERQYRLARALLSVDGKTISFDQNPQRDMFARETWIATLKGPLLLELSKAYERAAVQPVIELENFRRDPKPAP
jgi:hypothetical protein